MNIDVYGEAFDIITRSVKLNMQFREDCQPKNERELYDIMLECCSYQLLNDFVDKKFTPMEFNAIRNEIADILHNAFNK